VLATISIGIDPIAFRLGSLAVHWYGVFYVVAFVVAYYLGARPHVISRGISEENLERITGWTILFGLIGARLYYDVQNLDLMHNALDVIAVWNGGMAFYGAIIAGIATLIFLGWRWHLPIWVLLDGGAFFAVVGQPIGRLGNIINGDILGGPSNLPWATAYTNPDAVLQAGFKLGVAYQPAGAYEALGTLVILLILLGIRHRGVRPGVVVISYTALYSVSQLLLGFVRESEPVIWLGLKELQLTAIATLLVAVPVMVVIWRRTEGRLQPAVEVAAEASGGTEAKAAPAAGVKPAAKVRASRARKAATNAPIEKVADADTEDARNEDAKAEDAKAEDAKAEDAKAEDAKAEDAKDEDTKAEDTKAEDVRAEDAKAEDARAEDAKAEDARAEDAKAEDAKIDAEEADAERDVETDAAEAGADQVSAP
jgi:phosphatidylglycerol:prolipoprotein diacylglycerol transferase